VLILLSPSTPVVARRWRQLIGQSRGLERRSMDVNTQKEQFSIAYVRALAAVAAVKVDRHEVDDDSVDVLLSRAGKRSPHLHLQLKCSSDIDLKPDEFSFRLKLKNYDDLRRPTMVPRILAVLHVPEQVEDWVFEGPDHLLLRHRAYWLSLLGSAEVMATKKEDWQEKRITVRVPRTNQLTPRELVRMMDNIERTDAI
jgi:hypothetical protein